MEHCSALRLSLCILLVLNMTQPVARAAADTLDPAVYARAEALLGPNLVDQARNSFFTPHWLGDGELFWYRKELPNGHEDVVIDAATGKPTTRFAACGWLAAALEFHGQGGRRGHGSVGHHLPPERF